MVESNISDTLRVMVGGCFKCIFSSAKRFYFHVHSYAYTALRQYARLFQKCGMHSFLLNVIS